MRLISLSSERTCISSMARLVRCASRHLRLKEHDMFYGFAIKLDCARLTQHLAYSNACLPDTCTRTYCSYIPGSVSEDFRLVTRREPRGWRFEGERLPEVIRRDARTSSARLLCSAKFSCELEHFGALGVSGISAATSSSTLPPIGE